MHPSEERILAIGAHIGDMDLTAGMLLAKYAEAGATVGILDLTPGERGHPRMTPEDYRDQKIGEGKRFAERIGAWFSVLGYSDGLLPATDEVALEVCDVIREFKPTILLGHWRNSIHKDHCNASEMMRRGRFFAGLPLERKQPPHSVKKVAYLENWEDNEGYDPTVYVEIPEPTFQRWREAIEDQAFARGETYGFRYIDYYSALSLTRGCLAGVPRAVAVRVESHGYEHGPQDL